MTDDREGRLLPLREVQLWRSGQNVAKWRVPLVQTHEPEQARDEHRTTDWGGFLPSVSPIGTRRQRQLRTLPNDAQRRKTNLY
ncbi:hypothetical protein [Mesorhizobium muleiense]|uniref:hypothetical protein n=1 Tax=Mesorhizobium muleiense TaxID=1004279 RepID=UPI001F311358|nr:hypothetical protein [Mesorhizobium muleiense]MCF6112162.1 hypothetical protein [Mesorhizobium muleiense]